MDRGRALSLVALVALVAAVSSAARRQEPAAPTAEPAPWERIDLPSVATCGGCHQQVYREWSQSLHGRAWTNANARAQTENFAKASCRPCHSPLPVLLTGLDTPPDYRDFNQEDGVHCLACHGLTDGVAAARTIEAAPCRPRRSEGLVSADACWPCHQPTHQAYEEYEASRAFAAGVRCTDCHMPERPGGGRSHGAHGGLDAEFVRSALAWSARVEGERLLVELENLAAHKFPGEIPSRAFEVRVQFPGSEPLGVLLRKPNKDEARQDDRLLPDEVRTLEFALPPEAPSARVELLFRPLPLLPDQGAFSLGEWSWRRE
jgi:hypothetical protein